MKLDTLRPGDILLGDQKVAQIYKGSTLVYPIEDDQSLVFLDYIEVVDSYSLIVFDDFIPMSRNIRVITSMILSWSTYKAENQGANPFGTRYTYNDAEWRIPFGGSNSVTTNYIGMNSFNSNGYSYNNINPYYLDQTNYHVLDANVNKLYIDNQLICTCSDNAVSISHPQKFAILGTLTRGNEYWGTGIGRRFRYFKIWYEGDLLYDLLPAKKGKTYGMYNKVTGVFHTPYHPDGTLTGGFD